MQDIVQILARMGKNLKKRLSVVMGIGIGIAVTLIYLAFTGSKNTYFVYFILLCITALATPRLLRAIFTTRFTTRR